MKFLYNILTVFTFIFCGIFVQSAFAQKVIELTNITSGKKLIIKEGQRVEFTLKSNPGPHHVGVLESVGESSVTIQGKSIAINELRSIGRRRKGSGFWAFASGFVGAGLIIGAIQESSSDPCPSCTTTESSGGEWTTIEIGMGLAVLGLGINTVVRNSPRDVVSKWKLAIVDFPASTP